MQGSSSLEGCCVSGSKPHRPHAGAQSRNAAWNLLGQVTPFFVAIVAFPVLLHNLGSEGFGILSLCWLIVGYVSLLDLGMGRAITQAVAGHPASASEGELARLVWTGLALLAGVGMAFFFLAWPLVPVLVTGVLKVSPALRPDTVLTLRWVAASVPLIVLTAGLRGILEGCHRFRDLNIVRSVLGASLFAVPALLSFAIPNLPSIAISLAVLRVLGCVGHGWLALRTLPALRAHGPARRYMRPLYASGGWLAASNFFGAFIAYLDRLFLSAMLPMATIGYYNTSFEVVSKIIILPVALVSAWFPSLSHAWAMRREALPGLYREGWWLLFLIIFPLALALACVAPEGLALWMGQPFSRETSHIIQWLLLGVFFYSMAHFPYSLIQASGRAYLTARLLLLEIPAYAMLLVWLIGIAGAEGAAIAWMLRALVDWLILELLLKRETGSRASLLWLPVAAGLLIAGMFLVPLPPLMRFVIGATAACCALYQGLRWLRGIIRPRSAA